MKIRKQEVTDLQEQQAEHELRKSLGSFETAAPSERYWHGMIAGINRRIDDVSSGKALSLSWAARVAIPGVVAIISFYIGLHYYVPEDALNKTPISPILSSLSQTEIDSLLSNDLADNAAQAFSFSLNSADAEQYVLASGEPLLLVESFSDEQMELLLTMLSARSSLSM